MNIILVNHFGSKKDYAFRVPDEIASHIKKGDVLVVETRKGVDIGLAVSGIIGGDGAIDVANRVGANGLRPVIGFIDDMVYSFCENVIVEHIRRRTKGDTFFGGAL